MKEKSERNKTIDITVEEGIDYLNKCINISSNIQDINSIVNKTILGDTFEVLSYIPNNSIDLAILDPPYNLTKQFSSNTFVKKNDKEYTEYTEKWISLIMPLLKPTATIYVCCDWQTSLIIAPILKEHFYIQNRITWQREKGRGASKNWKNGLEDIWFGTLSANNYTFNIDDVKVRKIVNAPYKSNGQPKDWEETKYGNFRNTHPSNFWDDITIPYWSMKENTAHPTQKSEKLLAKLILASSNPNDIILDPFLGSGTTSVVAKKLKRNYIGIEQEKQYCIWAEKRLEMAENDTIIQGYADNVFWERNTSALQKKFQ